MSEALKIEEGREGQERPIHPSEKVYRAYCTGNMLIPQASAGMQLFIAKAVLEEGSHFADLRTQILSEEQLDDSYELMHHAHGHSGITYSAREKTGEMEEKMKRRFGESLFHPKSRIRDTEVISERLARLWVDVSEIVFRKISHMVHNAGMIPHSEDKRTTSAALDTALDENPEFKEHLLDIIREAVSVLQSEELKPALKSYRASFEPNLKSGKRWSGKNDESIRILKEIKEVVYQRIKDKDQKLAYTLMFY